jgi:aryl-alcohol dehydrogenase-like predicted oxidoreductase
MSKIILGTVQMGLKYGINNSIGKVSIEESHKILSKAILSGIDTLDTAEVYGDAHQVIGQFHRNQPGCKLKIVTKVPHDFGHNSIKSKVLKYLEDLNVESLEVLMFHSFESFLNNRQVIKDLIHLKTNGYINHIGVSVYTNDHIKYLLDEEEVSVVQLPFNLLDNFSIRGYLINQLKAKGKIIHTRSAFLQGLFFKNLNNQDKIVQKLYSHLELLKQITQKYSCSMEELALSYCIQQDNIDSVIIGVDSLDHLDSNLRASTFLISEDIIQKINQIKIENIDLLNPSLWNLKQS